MQLTDPLSTALSRICLPSWNVELVTLGHTDELKVPSGYGGLVAVLSGKAQLSTTEEPQECVALETGNAAVLLHGRGATVVCHDGPPPAINRKALPTSQAEQDSNSTKLVFARFPIAGYGMDSFVNVVPNLIRVADINGLANPIAHLIRSCIQESTTSIAGWSAIAELSAKLIVLHALREHLIGSPKPSNSDNWLRAALNPTIGPVLALIHAAPEKPWTVNSLAGACAMAKSAFSDRFRELVGESPLQYVTGYRMQIACRLLSTTDLGIREIAAQVGYESGSTFSNAFKRQQGKSPIDYRKQQAQ